VRWLYRTVVGGGLSRQWPARGGLGVRWESWRAALERWHRWSAVGGDGGDLVKLLGGRVAARFVWCGAAGGQWRDLATKSLVWRCEACAGPVHGNFGGASVLWQAGPVWGK
jgi:hypothetical protein